jgi:primosomal protein N'
MVKQLDIDYIRIVYQCPNTHDSYTTVRYNVKADSYECDLCGSHGAVEIYIYECEGCGNEHSLQLREW